MGTACRIKTTTKSSASSKIPEAMWSTITTGWNSFRRYIESKGGTADADNGKLFGSLLSNQVERRSCWMVKWWIRNTEWTYWLEWYKNEKIANKVGREICYTKTGIENVTKTM